MQMAPSGQQHVHSAVYQHLANFNNTCKDAAPAKTLGCGIQDLHTSHWQRRQHHQSTLAVIGPILCLATSESNNEILATRTAITSMRQAQHMPD